MMRVRPIGDHELLDFVAIGTDSTHIDGIHQYLQKMFAAGSMRRDWCFVVEDNAHLLGRLAFWTLPKVGIPRAIVLLDVPWDDDYLAVGAYLLHHSFAAMRAQGAADLDHVLDMPPQWPQWQYFSEQRQHLLTHAGFAMERETLRFDWPPTAALPPSSHRLTFRTLDDVGAAVFIDAIERVSAASLDQQTQHDRAALGAAAEAQQTWNDLQTMEYTSAWWQLAYTASGDLVGLVMPTRNPTTATIGYIGVVPEQRGRGYIHDLLAQGTTTLLNTGSTTIRADTDVANVPMIQAFGRASYTQFATRREYILRQAT
jgi:RimJ/RimL family protein N-acetyltransferase